MDDGALIEGESPFSPAGFLRLARQRLRHEPPPGEEALLIDHRLNPDFVAPPAIYRDAAVLIPVVRREPEATAILTLRMPHLSSHAGQIAFPGGKIEPGEGPAEAAIREAEEEIGLTPSAVHVAGYLDACLTARTNFRIYPVIAEVDPDFRLALNPNEVADAFEAPLSFLMDPRNHRLGHREFMGRTRTFYEMPFGDRYIWGVTAGIIRGLYERVYG